MLENFVGSLINIESNFHLMFIKPKISIHIDSLNNIDLKE